MARLSLALPEEYDLLRIEMTEAARLRQLIAKDCVAIPGVPNGSIARQVERAGFDAVYISGAGLANCTAGLPDIGLLTLTEVAILAGFIAKTVKIPAIVDADTGFGGVNNVRQMVRAFEAAGVSGLFISDQVFPNRCGYLPGKQIVPAEQMLAKITGMDFVTLQPAAGAQSARVNWTSL